MDNEIKFGTDGWRAVIADGFTFDNVKKVAQASCNVIEQQTKNRLLLIGYDRRFFSREFAETAARVAGANGFKVEITTAATSSPALAYNVRQRKAALGFMITASHNPFQFNGFKLKGSHGGPVSEDVTTLVENRIDTHPIQYGGLHAKKTDFSTPYLQSLKKFVSPTVVNALKGRIVFDAMHGPGADLFKQLIPKTDKIVYIRHQEDPLFGGVPPEPIETHLSALVNKVKETKALMGIAVDGDVDRIGLVDDKGRYLSPLKVMPLLLQHLIENRKLKGKFVQTVSMGYITERMCRHYKLPFEQTPVGFKYIAQKMAKEKVVLGGEESGGYGVGLWGAERDGLLCALLLIEFLVKSKKKLSELVDEIEKRYGLSHFKRVDVAVHEPVNKEEWAAKMVAALQPTPTFAGKSIKKTIALDGLKIVLDDDSWVLMRPSGTEPLLRTYAESADPALVDALLAEARQLHLTVMTPPKPAHDPKKNRKKKIKK